MTRGDAVALVERWRAQGKTIVFTNGVFDILHPGHIRYLRDARALGDLLIVGINSDRSVKALGKAPDRPINGEAERAEVLAALASVDAVVVFDEETPHGSSRRCSPTFSSKALTGARTRLSVETLSKLGAARSSESPSPKDIRRLLSFRKFGHNR